jgi:hypothetical protein
MQNSHLSILHILPVLPMFLVGRLVAAFQIRCE